MVCTGLYENIQDLSNVNNLTFFRRATTIKIEPLSFIKMTNIYKKYLSVDNDCAKTLAHATKGYTYAFQQLGVLFFKNHNIDESIDELKTEIFANSYEKIWEELTQMDRMILKLLTDKEEYKREEVLKLLEDKANNYSMYRDRLIKRGLINSRQAYIGLSLPYFDEFIIEYC